MKDETPDTSDALALAENAVKPPVRTVSDKVNKLQKARVSLRKEDRIAELHRQGYPAEIIATIVNLRYPLVNVVLRRIRRRWMYQDDPRKGRQRSFLNDDEIDAIKRLRAEGVTLRELGERFYGLNAVSIHAICSGRSYANPSFDRREDEYDYSPNFRNRLREAGRR